MNIAGFLTQKKEEKATFKISIDARKDFKAYKDVVVRYPDGSEATINRRGIENFFGVTVSVSDLPFGYPNCFIVPVKK